jgi:6 kDa early secretory antigenic target
MSDDHLKVNFGALEKASEDIQSGLNKMRQSLDTLESDAAKLVATWEGAAQDAYAARQRQWRAAANDLATMLGQIKSALDASKEHYFQTEQRNTGMFH